jgi:hypothetical protein
VSSSIFELFKRRAACAIKVLTYYSGIVNFFLAVGDNISQQTLDEHPLFKLNCVKQSDLCTIARDHASTSPIVTHGIKQEVNKFAISYLNGTYEVHIALICATMPRILLRLAEHSEKKIIIMVEKIQYLDQRYEFKMEIVRSVKQHGESSGTLKYSKFVNSRPLPTYLNKVPRSNASCHVADVGNDVLKKKLREHYLSNLKNRDRWEICIAAKRHFQRDVILDLVFSHNWYEIIRLYDIVYPDGSEKRNVPAFLCSSIPETYLRLLMDDSRKQFAIMYLLKHKK